MYRVNIFIVVSYVYVGSGGSGFVTDETETSRRQFVIAVSPRAPNECSTRTFRTLTGPFQRFHT